MKPYQGLAAIIALSVVMLAGSSASAFPLAAGANEIASGADNQALATPVAARRAIGSAPRMRVAPGVVRRPFIGAARPIIRPQRFVRPHRFVRRRFPVIIGIGPGFYTEPFPYYDDYYEGYYEAPYDDAIAYCIRTFRSYDLRTRTYLGFDGRRHPCP